MATNFRDMQAKHPGRALEKHIGQGTLPIIPFYMDDQETMAYGGAEIPTPPSSPKCWKSREP